MRATCLMPCLCLLLPAQDVLPLKTQIRAVRVHPDEAWILREGSLRILEAGTYRLAIADLPSGLTPDDLRVSAKGPGGTRLGELSLKSDPLLLKETKEWKQFQEEKVPLVARRTMYDARKRAHDAAVKFLDSLIKAHQEAVSRRLGSALPPSQSVVDLASVKEQRGAELTAEEWDLQLEEDSLQKEEHRLNAIESQLMNQRRTGPVTALVELSLAKPGLVDLELCQRTKACTWTPVYEARLSPDRRTIELALLASVKQETGEPWEGFRLEVATRPAQARLESPELGGPTFISFQEGPRRGAGTGATAGVVTIPSRVYTVDGSQDLPSGSSAQRFTLAVHAQAPTLHYLALPRESRDIFLLADLQPAPGFPLYAGAGLQLMAGSQRLGTQNLALPPAGAPLSLSFGPVPGLQTGLTLLQRKREQVGTFTKEREWTFLERLQVGNGSDQPLQVEVRDRIVRSSTDTVKVELGAATTPGWKESVPGVRTWTLSVPAGESRSVDLATQVRAPLDGRITNFGDLILEGN